MEEVFSSKEWHIIFGFDTSQISGDKILNVSSIVRSSPLLLLRDGHLSVLDYEKGDIIASLPAFSHNGMQTVYGGIRGLYIMDVEKNSKRQVSSIQCRGLSKPSWSPDDKQLVVGSNDWRIYSIDIEKGSNHELINFGIAPAVSPDGGKIAFLSRESDDEAMEIQRNHWKYAAKGQGYKSLEHLSWWKRLKWNDQTAVYIYDVDSCKIIKITKYYDIISPLVWSPDGKYLAFTAVMGFEKHNICILNIQSQEIKKIPDIHGQVMTWIK